MGQRKILLFGKILGTTICDERSESTLATDELKVN